MFGPVRKAAFLSLLALTLSSCQTSGGQAPTGSAAGSTSVGAQENLQRCSEPLGTLAIDDGREEVWWGAFTAATQVTTLEPLIRLVVAQSNCFVITSMGNSRQTSRMDKITNTQRNGEFRAGSKQEKGQRVAADYWMEPAVVFSESNTGAIGGAIGGALFGSVGSAIGGTLSMKSATTTLSLFDIRSQVQIGISTGTADSTDFGAMLGVLGAGAGGALGGYTKTPAGKTTVISFVNAYNDMVVSLKNYKAQNVRGGLGKGGTMKVGN